MKPPNWSREEIILALDLYMKHDLQWVNRIGPQNIEIQDMSKYLKQLKIHDEKFVELPSFRNGAGVYMKLMNFRRLDPRCSMNGLKNGSYLEVSIWNEFFDDVDSLRKKADEIKNSFISFNNSTVEFQTIFEDKVRGINLALVSVATDLRLLAEEYENFGIHRTNGLNDTSDIHHILEIMEYSIDIIKRKISCFSNK